MTTTWILIAFGVFIVALTIVSILGVLPAVRIVPDDTKFDFIRFRRISFPISALLSIVAITLFFTHGLNFGIDFKGGTLLEIQDKSGPADLAKLRATLGALSLGDIQLQQFGGPADVLIRDRGTARRRRGPAGRGAEGARRARRQRRLPPRRGGRTARVRRTSGLRHDRPDGRDRRHPDLSVVPLRMAVRARRHDRQRPRYRADASASCRSPRSTSTSPASRRF